MEEAKRVTDEMFIAAAEAVAEQVTQADLEHGLIYPRVLFELIHPTKNV